MRPCRILMTVDAVGGVWQYACDLGAALRPLGVETVLALLGPRPGDARRQALDPAVELIETRLDLDWLAPDADSVARAGATLATLAARLGVDLVHINHPAFAATPFGLPVVTTIHSCVATWWQAVHGGAAPSRFAWQTDLVSRGLRRSDVVAAPSAAFAEAVRRTYDLRSAPHVVPNGRRFPVRARTAPEAAVVTAGRLWDPGKNIAMLDRAAARLAHPVRAAGDVRGPHGESIVLRHIEPLGSLDALSLAAHLARCAVFVSTALYEPFGLAVLEAAATGCPLVLADTATFREIWEGAATFVAPGDEDGFVAAIEALVGDAEMQTRQGARARGRAAQFTPSRMAAGMRALYGQALAGSETRAAVA